MRMRLATLAVTVAIATTQGLTAAPVSAFTPVSEFKDITPDHWAYNAIKALVEKYQIMEGFPDNTFRGTRTISRFELAAALAKVMARVEEMVASATGETPQPTRIQPNVNADDLRTIGRLQQEFKDELTGLKGRVDTQDQRLTSLEKRLRLGGSLEALYRTYTVQPNKQASEMDDLRIATHLTLDSDMGADLSYRGQLSIYNVGVKRFANGYQGTEGGQYNAASDTGTPLYVRRSYFSWTPAAVAVHAGVMTFSDTLRIGSSLKNDFRTGPTWIQAQSGYGFVGTPPLQPPTSPSTTDQGALVVAPIDPLSGLPIIPGRVHWNPGVNVAEDLLDPNSVWAVNTGAAPAAVVTTNFGPVELGAGLNYGTPGASTQLALSDLPRTFPVIAEYYQGYSLAKAGVDLGIARVGAYGRADNAALSQLTNALAPGKGWGATVDLGTDALGLNVGFAEMTRRNAFDSNRYAESSAFLVTNSLFGTGIGLGIGTKLGDSPAANMAGRAMSFVDYDWSSTGAYVRVPFFSVIPTLTIAAQHSGRSLFATDLGSGLSAIAEIQIAPSLPTLLLEYDMGRFYGTSTTPSADPGKDNQLIGGSFPTHEQIVLGTSVKF